MGNENTTEGKLTKQPFPHEGMMLLDWWAGLAMQAMISVEWWNSPAAAESGMIVGEWTAAQAYGFADDMLAEKRRREK